MRQYQHLLTALFLVFLVLSCTENGDAKKAADYTPAAEQFVNLLVGGEYEKAVKSFDATMKDVLPANKLEDAWQNLITQVGHYKRQVGVRQTKDKGFDIVFVTCEFEKGNADIQVVFNDAKEIAGLWFLPPQKFK